MSGATTPGREVSAVPDRRCARAALVAVVAVLATATGGGTAAGADAERGSASLQAEVQQLRRDVERTSAQLADGAQALEAAQSRHQSLVQRQAAATADADGGRAGQQRARSQARALARQAYTGARTPRPPLVLTNDLGAVADLEFLRRSLDRVGASQGELLQGQALRGVRAEREVVAGFRRLVSVGEPEQVREALLARARHAGADELMVTTAVHDPAERLHSYALLADAFALTTPGRTPVAV